MRQTGHVRPFLHLVEEHDQAVKARETETGRDKQERMKETRLRMHSFDTHQENNRILYLSEQERRRRVRETQFPLTKPEWPPPTVGVTPFRHDT